MSVEQPNVTSSMAQTTAQQPLQHTGAIAIDTRLFKNTVNLDCRLEVYKSTFPEMDRSKPPARPKGSMDRIKIKYEECCSRLNGLHPPMVLPPPCTTGNNKCMECEHRSYNKLESMLTSNFAKDSELRQELLPFYFQLVQFEWGQQACERGETKIYVLQKFFETFAPAGLNEQFKHLTIHFPWKYTGFKAPDWSAGDSFRTDSVAMGRALAVLHKYKIKAELTFPSTQAVRLGFVKRVEELCKANLCRDGPMFWQQVNAQDEGIFRFDAELRRLADEAVGQEEVNRKEWVRSRAALKYDIDFSQ
jgi:hypothetical protein